MLSRRRRRITAKFTWKRTAFIAVQAIMIRRTTIDTATFLSFGAAVTAAVLTDGTTAVT